MMSTPVVCTETGSQRGYASQEISVYMILTLVQAHNGFDQKPERQTTTNVSTKAALFTCGQYENARPACGPKTKEDKDIR